MGKGLVLALLNVFLVALGIAWREGEAQAFFLVGIYGTLPALLCGAFVGALATAFAQAARPVRYVVILAPCAALVYALGSAFGMSAYVVGAFIPTMYLCQVLEQWTRVEEADEQVPTARVA